MSLDTWVSDGLQDIVPRGVRSGHWHGPPCLPTPRLGTNHRLFVASLDVQYGEVHLQGSSKS